MPLRYSDLIDIMMQRAERLGLTTTAEQKADAAELEVYVFQALLHVTEVIDIPIYLQNNTEIAITSSGHNTYPMPQDYGRLIAPRVQNRRGIYLYDTVRNVDLEYLDPNSFARQSSLINERPTQFTVTQRTLWLYPTPDDNGTDNYTVRGLYVQRVERPELDDEVLLTYPTALIDEALFRLASDMGRPIQALAATRTEALTRLVNGNK